ncbi:MAG: CvpA family protein [Cytophagales bacterium]|nr:CvpA family protein [Cytophagales bacterium]
MKTIDILILVPLAFGAYKGYKKGLLMEFATVFAFIAATVGAFSFFDEGVELIKPLVGEDNKLVPLLAILGIFGLIMILVALIGKGLKKIIDVTLLGVVDNIGGALLGMLKWAFGLSVILWLTNKAHLSLPIEATQGAILYPYVVDYSPVLIDFVSQLLPFSQDLVKNINELLDKK